MISIKKFLSADDRKAQEATEASERMTHLLLQAIGLHAVEGDKDDYNTFRVTIADLETNLANEPSPNNFLITTGAAIKALQDYNRRTSFYIRARSVELQTIVGMLTNAMGQISTASQTSIEQLQDLQRQIGQAVMVEDMRTVKRPPAYGSAAGSRWDARWPPKSPGAAAGSGEPGSGPANRAAFAS